MFETLFSYPAVLRRHRDGPLAAERAVYLEGLAIQGTAHGTLLRRAAYCLCVAQEVEHLPPDHLFDRGEIDALAGAWAAARTAKGRTTASGWPEEHFRFAAIDFLRGMGRLRPPPSPTVGRYDQLLEDFIAAQREGPWLSEATCRSARWQIVRFLRYLEQQDVALGDVEPDHIDALLPTRSSAVEPDLAGHVGQDGALVVRTLRASRLGEARPGRGDPAAADLPA